MKHKPVILGLVVLGVGLLATITWWLTLGDGFPPWRPCVANCAASTLPNGRPPGSQTAPDLTSRASGSQRDDRFGVVATGDIDHALNLLGVQWWYSFTSSATARTGTRVMLIPTRTNHGVVIRESASNVQAMAQANPGRYWIIGNEPNVPGQDNVTPEQYVDEFRYYASTIRGVDPAAKFVGPNVLNFDTTCSGCDGFTPGRAWVKRFVTAWSNKTASALPFDAWGIHVYSITWDTLPMVDATTAERELASFSEFVATLPTERSKPIWLTEFGVIWGFPGADSPSAGCAAGTDCLKPTGAFAAESISAYLNQLLGWLASSSDRYRVRKWFLYTTSGSAEPYATEYAGISLLNSPTSTATLTPLGAIYRSYANPKS